MDPTDALTVDNPFTGEPACTVPLADAARVSAVLDRARAAARVARGVSVAERVAWCERAMAAMEAHAESIAADITAMMGKPLAQARNEVRGMIGRAQHMTAIAAESLADLSLPKDGFERRIVREPLGVVFNLPAWNYPLLTAVNVFGSSPDGGPTDAGNLLVGTAPDGWGVMILSTRDYGCAWEGSEGLQRGRIRDALEFGANLTVFAAERRRLARLERFAPPVTGSVR